MNHKVFSQRFNREISTMGLPEEHSDKIKAISIVFDVTKHLANGMVFGHASPAATQLDKIAEILDVCPTWLSGDTDRKKGYTSKADVN